VNANQAAISVSVACRTLGVSASGYYAWVKRAPSRRALDDAVLTERIRAIHAASDANYGSPNIHAELRDEGTHVGRKRVSRLMRQAGIRGVSRRRGFVVTTQRDPKQRPAPDLVNRRFVAEGPNELWVADMTYVPTWAGFIYLAIVLDVWSRRVTWRSHSGGRARSFTIAIRVHNTPASRSVSAAKRWPCGPRWAVWETPTTTRWPRASSRASSAS
jgi:putative transposase